MNTLFANEINVPLTNINKYVLFFNNVLSGIFGSLCSSRQSLYSRQQ